VPAPPTPLPTAVITVPGVMYGPVIWEPTERVPEEMELTVRVDPEMEPVKAAEELAPTTAALSTVCVEGAATVYVPTPPLPVPSAVTTVPGVTPGAVMGVPTAMVVPGDTDDTERVLPEIETTAAGTAGGATADAAVVGTVCGMLTV